MKPDKNILVVGNFTRDEIKTFNLLMKDGYQLEYDRSASSIEKHLISPKFFLIIINMQDAHLIERLLEAEENNTEIKPFILFICQPDLITRESLFCLKKLNYDIIKKPLNHLELSLRIEFLCRIRENEIQLQNESQKLYNDLSRSEKRFSNLLQNYPNGFVNIFDSKYRFIYADGAGLKTIGLSKEKLIGRTLKETFPSKTANKLMNFYNGVWRGNKIEFEYELFDQKYFAAALPIKKEDGSIYQIISISQDITELKNAQDEIKVSEEKFRTFMNNLPAGAFIKDLKGKFVFVNKFNEEKLGVVNWSGKESYEYFQEYDAELFKIHDEEVIAKGKAVYYNKTSDVNGKEIYFSTLQFLIPQTDGSFNLGGISLDITKEVKTNTALKVSEEKFKNIFHNSPLGLFRSNLKGELEEINDKFASILGYKSTREAFKNISKISEIFEHSEDYSRLNQELNKHDCIENFEFLGKRSSTRKLWISLSLIIDYDEEKGGFFEGVIQDITQRKISEEQLKASKERFELVMKAADEGIFELNLQTREAYFSPGWKNMLGYQEDEIINEIDEMIRLINPDDVEEVLKIINELREGKRSVYQIEFRMRNKNGFWIDVLSSGTLVLDDRMMPLKIVGSHINITERNKTINELKERMSQLEKFNKVLADRELRMIELKNEINELHKKLKLPPKYSIPKIGKTD